MGFPGPGTFGQMVPGTRDHRLKFDWDQGPKLKGPQGPGTTLKIRIYFICRYSEEYLKNPKDKTYKGNQKNDSDKFHKSTGLRTCAGLGL